MLVGNGLMERRAAVNVAPSHDMHGKEVLAGVTLGYEPHVLLQFCIVRRRRQCPKRLQIRPELASLGRCIVNFANAEALHGPY
jgi:hypothetical protein